MAGLSDYAEKAILNHVFGATTFTPPATLYIALVTAGITIDDTTTGTAIATYEPSGGNYSRAAVTNNTTNFPNATGTGNGGSSKTNALITFPTPSGSWGTVTQFAICDAATNGNIITYGTLGVPQTISSGNTVQFSSSSLTITLD